LGIILKFAFELKNMLKHIFRPKAKRSKATQRKEAAGSRAASSSRRVEDLNGGTRGLPREGAGRLSRRRYSCARCRPLVQTTSGEARNSVGMILGNICLKREQAGGTKLRVKSAAQVSLSLSSSDGARSFRVVPPGVDQNYSRRNKASIVLR
jgi:hypothetical protein